jgi:succinate dehydrogenase / fumarate reductase cytochrome b subunit
VTDTALSRHVSLWTGVRYRGRLGMANWALHRVTGLAILLLVGLHVTASFLGQRQASDLAYSYNALYESWAFQLFVYFCVLFHAFNGLRLASMDLAPSLVRFHRELAWLQWAILVPTYGLGAFLLVSGATGG